LPPSWSSLPAAVSSPTSRWSRTTPGWLPRSLPRLRSGERRQVDLDAAVLGAAVCARVGRDRLRGAKAADGEAAAVDTTLGEEASDRIGAALGQHLVVLQAAGGVGVAVDVDEGAVVLVQHHRNRIQRVVEGRHHLVLVGREGNVRRHVEDDLVADAGNRYTSALQIAAQFRLLLVHVATDGAACQRTDAGADQRVAAVVTSGEHADPGARKRTQRRATSHVRHLLLARIRVGRAAGQKRSTRKGQNDLLHSDFPLLNKRGSGRSAC